MYGTRSILYICLPILINLANVSYSDQLPGLPLQHSSDCGLSPVPRAADAPRRLCGRQPSAGSLPRGWGAKKEVRNDLRFPECFEVIGKYDRILKWFMVQAQWANCCGLVLQTVIHHSYPNITGCMENCPYQFPRQSALTAWADNREASVDHGISMDINWVWLARFDDIWCELAFDL